VSAVPSAAPESAVDALPEMPTKKAKKKTNTNIDSEPYAAPDESEVF